MMKIDGHENAEVGVMVRFNQDPILVYDYNKVIENLVNDGMTHEEASEFFEFNIIGAWVGEGTPGFIVSSDEYFIDE